MVGSIRLDPGSVFARDFVIGELLGAGGMGTVYAALDRSTGEPCALKVLLPELVADERSRHRFAQEARIGAEIDSPFVVKVHRAGVDEHTGVPWIAMDRLVGRDLRAHVHEHGPLSWDEAWATLEPLGMGLAAAHARGLVHRDLKPQNVFLDTQRGAQRVVLLDFGVAKVLDVRRTSATGTAAVGSPLWMAPEQTTAGNRISAATDVFAYGLIAFYVLTGELYWRAASAKGGMTGLLRELHVDPIEPASLRAMEVAPDVRLPAGFDEWFAHAVVRQPSDRFRDAGAALEGLRQALGLSRPSSGVHAVTLAGPAVAPPSYPPPPSSRPALPAMPPPPRAPRSVPPTPESPLDVPPLPPGFPGARTTPSAHPPASLPAGPPSTPSRPPSVHPSHPRGSPSWTPPSMPPGPASVPPGTPSVPPSVHPAPPSVPSMTSPPTWTAPEWPAPRPRWPWVLLIGAAGLLAGVLVTIIVWILVTIA